MRMDESRSGHYDFGKLFDFAMCGKKDINVADYVGPVEVADIPGKGKTFLRKLRFMAYSHFRQGSGRHEGRDERHAATAFQSVCCGWRRNGTSGRDFW